MTLPEIGVAITTHNRRPMFLDTLARFRAHTPPNIPIIIVDDGSDAPFDGATIRNPRPRGIARAKNQSIAALMDAGVEHLFLCDDDCYPTADGWWQPYVDSGEHHLSLQLRWQEHCRRCRTTTLHNYNTIRGHPTCDVCVPAQAVFEDTKIHAVQWGSGVFLYFTRHAIDTIGGFRTEFGRYGGEHLDIAYRARNAGLIRYPFQDVLNPQIYAIDAHSTGRRSCIPEQQRREHNARGWQLFEQHQHDHEYVEYREVAVNPAVCLPWRPTPDRIAAHDRCIQFWTDNGFATIEADSDDQWLCNQARNNAVRQATTDIVIIADADTEPADISQVHTAIDLIAGGQADIVYPHTEYRHIPADWVTKPDLAAAPIKARYTNSPGGIVVANRAKFWDIGGFDEKFEPGAWGFDDRAFMLTAQTLLTTRRVPGIIFSFDHSCSEYVTGGRDLTDNNPNKARGELFRFAHGKPAVMRALLK